MPFESKYTDEDRRTALALVFRIGTSKTAKELNISVPVITKWKREEIARRQKAGIETRVTNVANSTDTRDVVAISVQAAVSTEVKALVARERENIHQMVRSELAWTIKRITESLLQLTGDALIEAQRVIDEGPGKSSPAEWLRSVASVFEKSVQLHQIILGKPIGQPLELPGQASGNVVERLEKYVVVYRDLEARHRVLQSGNAGDHPGEPLDPDQSGA